MSELLQSDPVNKRHHAMWVEAGIQFRANIVDPDGLIEFHSHDFDHVSLVTSGHFSVREVSPDGIEKRYEVAAKSLRIPTSVGYRITILARHEHEFRNIGSEQGEILCLLPE